MLPYLTIYLHFGYFLDYFVAKNLNVAILEKTVLIWSFFVYVDMLAFEKNFDVGLMVFQNLFLYPNLVNFVFV